MPERRSAIYAVLSLSILLAACGQVDPNASAPRPPVFAASATAGAVATTGGGPSWAIVPATPDGTPTPVNHAMNAAIAYAKSMMHATNPSVAEASQGLFHPADPKSNVWVVRLVGDTFQLPPCPPGTPQTSYARTCGSGTQARLGLRISDLSVEYAEVYSAGTPIAQTPITLPPNAKLPTREIAIKTILGGIQGTDGGKPHLISADLILAADDPNVGDLPPDTPIWRIKYDHGEFMDSHPPEADQAARRIASLNPVVTIWVGAISGLYHLQTVDIPTPTP